MAPFARALVANGLLDAVHLLLVPALILHGALLGLLQCTLQGLNSLSRSPSSFAIVSFWAFVFSFSFSYFFFHCSAVNSRFTEAVDPSGDPATDRCPNIRVDLVSASL
ncbi:hypothetical protein H8957_010746 [Semnopithecus entellus]